MLSFRPLFWHYQPNKTPSTAPAPRHSIETPRGAQFYKTALGFSATVMQMLASPGCWKYLTSQNPF
jgi:hypothetical protein